MSTIRYRLTPRLLSWSCAALLLVLLFSPLTASAANLTGLSLTPPNPTLNISDSLQLIATGSYDDGTQQVIAQAKQVSAGVSYTCALSTDGTLQCWGDNVYGQLGNGTTTSSSTPVTVSGLSTAVAVSAGWSHTCAALANGTVQCWGYNAAGQLGNGTTTSSSTPVTVSGLSTAVAVSAAGIHTCALLADGTVRCWGSNNFGLLGNGTTTSSSTPVPVSGLTTAVAVSAGSDHTCALLANGTVQCWGYNVTGQLGNGTTTSSSTPVTVSGLSTAVAVSAGDSHTCAALANGTVQCWGYNYYGQLGNGTTTPPSTTPVAVSGITTAVAVSAGFKHTCALLANGTVQCWGYNYYGQLGNYTTSPLTPVTVSGISTAVAVSAGDSHTCAALAGGMIKCWGYNVFGQLGNGTTTYSSTTPVAVSGLNPAVAVSASGYYNCALLTDGTLRCWGGNSSGQLGNGTTTYSSTTPVVVSGLNTAVAISAGGDYTYGGGEFTCAVLANGTVQWWGYHNNNEPINNPAIYSSTPVTVSSISTAVAVSAGGFHICALLADGTIKCWLANGSGQLGNGTTTSSSTPVTVSGISTAVAISAGDIHACATLADGTVQCWGNNVAGQLGNASTSYLAITSPVTVSGISTAVAVSAGGLHTCAVLADGTVQCWGRNSSGQLGNGTTTSSSTPVTVSGLSTAVAVSAGDSHTCAALANGTVQCWGYNYNGELGNGTTANTLAPVTVSGISTAVAVSTGFKHTCAVLANGTVQCWGYNYYGQLGNGTGVSLSTPSQTLDYFPIAWSSGDSLIASVTGIGRVDALTSGTTQITASLAGINASTTVTVVSGQPPVASDVNATAVSGTSITWTPIVSDPNGDPITCRLGTPPANGTATVATNCSSGAYQSNPGFIGTDSFTYIANDGLYDSRPGTVTVAVTEGSVDQICLQNNPISQFSQTGKEGTLTISFTGNITAHANKAVKVCPGTTLKYSTTSTKGPVVCKVKNNTTRGSGILKINDHIKCTDKPAGKDKVGFKVKSGVNK